MAGVPGSHNNSFASCLERAGGLLSLRTTGESKNLHSPSGVSEAIFNFDFKGTCQVPGYKPLVEMTFNRSNRLSVLGLGYAVDLVSL